MNAMRRQANPSGLEGITLEAIVTRLAGTIGWGAMAAAIPVRCFTHDPSVKSSLKFLRRTTWARKKVELLYWQHELAKFDRTAPTGTGGGYPDRS